MLSDAPVSRPARLIRGWAAAGVCTLCAAASHHAMDPAPLQPVLLALVLCLAGVGCVLLAGRRLGAVRTALAVLASQVPFHLVFAAGGHASAAVDDGGVGLGAHAHHLHGAGAATTGAATTGAAAAPSGAGTAALDPSLLDPTLLETLGAALTGHMLWAHVAAAAVTFVLLRHAEDGWWRLVTAAVHVIFTPVELLSAVLVPWRPLRPVPQAHLLPPRTWSPARVISRRGPPALSI